jgi:hypothetical protein
MVEESSWALRKAVGSLFGLGAAVRRECTMNVSSLTMEQEYEMQQSWRLDEDSKSAFAPKQPV